MVIRIDILFMVMLVGFGVTAAIASYLYRRRGEAGTDPTCGNCGYCVRGIASLNCPECGSDLREVGIITANTPVRARKISGALKWSIMLPVPAFLLSLLMLNTILPFAQTQKVIRAIVCQTPYLMTTINVLGIQRVWQPVLVDSTIQSPGDMWLFDNTNGLNMDFNFKTGPYSYWTSSGTQIRRTGGLNGQVIADWLGSGSAKISDPRLIELGNSIYAALIDIPQAIHSGLPTHMTDSSGAALGIAQPVTAFTVHDEPSPWVIVGLVTFWLLVWLFGLRIIQRRSKRT